MLEQRLKIPSYLSQVPQISLDNRGRVLLSFPRQGNGGTEEVAVYKIIIFQTSEKTWLDSCLFYLLAHMCDTELLHVVSVSYVQANSHQPSKCRFIQLSVYSLISNQDFVARHLSLHLLSKRRPVLLSQVAWPFILISNCSKGAAFRHSQLKLYSSFIIVGHYSKINEDFCC